MRTSILATPEERETAAASAATIRARASESPLGSENCVVHYEQTSIGEHDETQSAKKKASYQRVSRHRDQQRSVGGADAKQQAELGRVRAVLRLKTVGTKRALNSASVR
jgi:hypothetical protein